MRLQADILSFARCRRTFRWEPIRAHLFNPHKIDKILSVHAWRTYRIKLYWIEKVYCISIEWENSIDSETKAANLTCIYKTKLSQKQDFYFRKMDDLVSPKVAFRPMTKNGLGGYRFRKKKFILWLKIDQNDKTERILKDVHLILRLRNMSEIIVLGNIETYFAPSTFKLLLVFEQTFVIQKISFSRLMPELMICFKTYFQGFKISKKFWWIWNFRLNGASLRLLTT